MNLRLLLVLCLFYINSNAQKPCDWSENGADSLGTFKALKDVTVYENKFGNSSSYIFLSLRMENEVPYLSFKYIKKSKDFIPVNCFDKNSRLFLQLDNGKVITLMHTDTEKCGTTLYLDGFHSTVTEGTFLFRKGSFEDLQASPISIIRVRYATETTDFPVVSELKSELTKEVCHPQRYFIEQLPCILQ